MSTADWPADYGIRPMTAEQRQRHDTALIVIRSRLRTGAWRPLPPARRSR